MKKLPILVIAILAIVGIAAIANINRPKLDVYAEAADTTNSDNSDVEEPHTSVDNSDADGSDMYFDTLFMINGKAIAFGSFDDSDNYVIGYDGKPFAYDPTTNFDSISASTFGIDLIGRRKVFDAGRPGCIQEINAFLSPIKGFRRYSRDYVEHIDTVIQESKFVFVVDFPDSAVDRHQDIAKWLISLIEREQIRDQSVIWEPTQFTGYRTPKNNDPAELGRNISKAYFKTLGIVYEGELPYGAYFTLDFRARVHNDRYVTYRGYVAYREWLGHGMYTESLHSYDLQNNKEIDFDYLFRPNTSDGVCDLLCETIAADIDFTADKELGPNAQGVKEWILRWQGDFDPNPKDRLSLPKPALTDDGIVFSFQPYEIDCFAGGAWHFTVPYAKAKPYMTKQAKKLLGL